MVTNRARAAFLGLALGDALGATTEFMTPGEIRNQYKVHRNIIGGGWLHLKPGRVTDDTEMSLCVGRAIVDRGGVGASGDRRQLRFLDEGQADRHRQHLS